MKHLKWLVLCVLLLILSGESRAASLPKVRWFKLPAHSSPTMIVPDGDNTVWFGDSMKPEITQIDIMGHIRTYPIRGTVNSLARDKANRLWFGLYKGGIGYIENGHVIQLSYTGGAYSLTFHMGAIWFLSGLHGYGTVDRADHIRLFPLSKSFNATAITGGPDGNLWLTDRDDDFIGKLDSQGLLIAYPLPPGSYPMWITNGPNKTLWFLNKTGVGRITLSGEVKLYVLNPYPSPYDSYGNIILGQNDTLIFSMDGEINQITLDGKVTTLARLVGGEQKGPDNGDIVETSHLLWFTDGNTGKVGYISL